MFTKFEQEQKMNTVGTITNIERDVVDQATANLKKIGYLNDIEVITSKTDSYDFNVTIDGHGFACMVKNSVTKNNFGFVLSQLQEITRKENLPVLLITKLISPNLMDELQANNINTLDVSGNTSIIHDTLRIVIKGEKSIRQQATLATPGRLFKDAGLKFLFGILTNPDMINYTYREMQEIVDVSLGSITNSMEDIEENGFLIKNGNKRVLSRRKEIIDRWVIAYNEALKPKLFLTRMSFNDNIPWQSVQLAGDTYWGGEPASYLLNGFLLPEDFMIYTREKIGHLVRSGLRPDESGNVFVYNKFWKSNNSNILVPRLLVYADLMGSGYNRNIEAAQKLAKDGL